MKRKSLILCFAVLMLAFPVFDVSAISEAKKSSIIDNCNKIKDSLKNIQKADSRARIFLGSHYETVLSKFITPLNVRLVENNMSKTYLIENQSEFATARGTFIADYINYQQGLEDLVAIDCRTEPEHFYEKLVSVRTKREKMVSDASKIKGLINKNIKLVDELKEKL